VLDWRPLEASEQPARLAELLRADRHRGFEVRRADAASPGAAEAFWRRELAGFTAPAPSKSRHSTPGTPR
jgi:hypothetical protein